VRRPDVVLRAAALAWIPDYLTGVSGSRNRLPVIAP